MNNISNNLYYQSKTICCRQLLTGTAVSLFFWLLASTSAVASGIKQETGYDQHFRHYAMKFFGSGFDWRLFKSQGVIESQLKQHAKSHRGAKGIMQLMPATYREIQKKNIYFRKKRSNTAQVNIAAGIFYDFYLYQRWGNKNVSPDMRLNLMLASYNGGYSRVLKAYNKAGKPVYDWNAVAEHLPKETRNYVKRVIKHYEKQQRTIVAQQTHRNGCWIGSTVTQSIC